MTEPTQSPLDQLTRRIEEHADFVRSLARSLLGDEHGADDVVQETWIAAWRDPASLRLERSWLARVVRNLGINHRLAASRRQRRELAAWSATESPASVDEALKRELIRKLGEIVTSLDEPYRAVVIARYYDGLPPREIAAQRGVAVATVKSQLRRGLQSIRARFDDDATTDWRMTFAAIAGFDASVFGVSAAPLGSMVIAMKLKLLLAGFVVVLTGVAWVGLRDDDPNSNAAEVAQPSKGDERSEASPSPPALEVASTERVGMEEGVTTLSPPVDRFVAHEIEGAAVSKARVGGRVVDDNGNPIAGAKVVMRPKSASSPSRLFDAAKSEVTAPDGAFRVEDLDGGDHLIGVQSDGFVPLSGILVAVRPGVEQRIEDLVLTRGASTRLRVTDARGAVVPGVAVFVVDNLPNREGRGSDSTSLRDVGKTAADGTIRVMGISERSVAIALNHHRFVPLIVPIPDPPSTGEWELTLEEGWSVSGEVVGATSKVALEVEALPTGASSWGSDPVRWRLYLMRRHRIDLGGRFNVTGLPLGEPFFLRLDEKVGGAPRTASMSVEVTEQSGDVTLHYLEPAWITVRATDAASREAVLDLQVERSPSQNGGGSSSSLYRVDARDGQVGSVRVQVDPTDDLRLALSADGYRSVALDPISVVAGQTVELPVIAMERVAGKRVLVVDGATSLPVAHAIVVLEPGSSENEEGWQLTPPGGRSSREETNEAGIAMFDPDLFIDATLRVTHPSYLPWSLPAPTDGKETRVALTPAASVTLRLVDSMGRLVANTVIQREDPNEGSPSEHASSASGRDAQSSDREGRVVFTGLVPGLHRFRVQTERRLERNSMIGGAIASVQISDIELSDPVGEVVLVAGEARELTLTVPARVALSGRVRDRFGPVSGVSLSVMPGGVEPSMLYMTSGSIGTKSSVDGSYRLEGIDEGEGTLIVRHADLPLPVAYAVELNSDENVFHVDLPMTRLFGTVTGESGPIPGVLVKVVATQPGGGYVTRPRVLMVDESGVMHMDFGTPDGGTTLTDAEGHYELKGLPAVVSLRVTVSHASLVSESVLVTLAADEEREQEFHPERGGTITARFRTPEQAKIRNVMVVATYRGGASVAEQEHFSSGSSDATLTGLQPGPWTLKAIPMGEESARSPQERAIDVDPDHPIDVTLIFPVDKNG